MHFYSRAYPALPGTLNPPDATVADYAQVRDWLGIDRAIVVQPNAYGDDNRADHGRRQGTGRQCARASWW